MYANPVFGFLNEGPSGDDQTARRREQYVSILIFFMVMGWFLIGK